MAGLLTQVQTHAMETLGPLTRPKHMLWRLECKNCSNQPHEITSPTHQILFTSFLMFERLSQPYFLPFFALHKFQRKVRHACTNHYKFSASMSLWSRDNVQAKCTALVVIHERMSDLPLYNLEHGLLIGNHTLTHT